MLWHISSARCGFFILSKIWKCHNSTPISSWGCFAPTLILTKKNFNSFFIEISPLQSNMSHIFFPLLRKIFPMSWYHGHDLSPCPDIMVIIISIQFSHKSSMAIRSLSKILSYGFICSLSCWMNSMTIEFSPEETEFVPKTTSHCSFFLNSFNSYQISSLTDREATPDQNGATNMFDGWNHEICHRIFSALRWSIVIW